MDYGIHISMYLKQIPNKDGRIYLTIAESRRIDGKSKTITVEGLGYLDELQKQFDDPVAYFDAEAKRRTKEAKAKKRNEGDLRASHFPFSSRYDKKDDKPVLESVNKSKSLGYIPLLEIFNELELGYFVDNRRRYTEAEYNHTAIWKMLCIGRILFPLSKLGTWRRREELPEKMNFSDDDVYRSLPFFAKHKDAMIGHTNSRLEKLGYRDKGNLMFYDVTNYYWEIDDPDGDAMLDNGEIIPGLRKRGCSKEHRPEPIVQMGLMMDAGGIPCGYGLFEGNKNDVTTFVPMMSHMREVHKKENIIFVGDKGMMSGNNITALILGHNGFIISKSVRNCTKEVKKFVLDMAEYQKMKDEDAEGTLLLKERTMPTAITIKGLDGKEREVTINLRQIAFFSKKYQQRARKERAAAIEKALRNAKTRKKDAALNTYGSNKYLKKTIFDGDNEVENPGFEFSLDEKAIEEDEMLDGYYLIFSNVYGTDKEHGQTGITFNSRDCSILMPEAVTAKDIVDMYRQLWKIEHCFRITKSFLKTRPVYVHEKESIEAHFLSCYVSLVILRVLEKKTKESIEIEKIVEELRKASLFVNDSDGWWYSTYCSNIIEAIGKATGLDLTRERYLKTDIRRMIASTKEN